MMKRYLKPALVLALAVMLLFSTSLSAFAGEAVDLNRKGSLVLTLRDSANDHKPIPGGTFTVYPVASVKYENFNIAYSFTPEFADCGVDLNDLNVQGLGGQLEDYAVAHELTGITQTADKNGVAVFVGLPLGLYLVMQEGNVEGYYAISAFLASVPMRGADGEWVYDVDASPKAEVNPGETTSLSVKKVWNDNGKERPSSVTVQLLKGNEVVETVTLSDSNQWYFTWDDLSCDYEWSVKEINVPSGYTAGYYISDNVTTITNTSSLIVTGQLNWPVPVLAGCGVLLFAGGWFLTFVRKKKTNEEK